MDEPSRLWRAVALGSLILSLGVAGIAWGLGFPHGALGVLIGAAMLGWIMGYYGFLVWLLRGKGVQRLLPLFNLAKYPLMMAVVYGVVQGGTPMVIGFVVGVVIPLAVMTALAIWSAFTMR
ncbi:MAG: hypothetical protein N2045_12760 [Fimbriimonadales bacterium]|jgi:hypothetical protein|nr:hypothetical protein [Armatimonadota bacterium]MCX7688830.1 hypothetical protein [Fimbriimonadales bacterium]